MALFTNDDATGTLAHPHYSRVHIAANDRQEGAVFNLHQYATLYVSFGADCGDGVGSVPVEPRKGLDFSDSPVRLAGEIHLTGTTEGQTFTFQEVGDAQSAITTVN